MSYARRESLYTFAGILFALFLIGSAVVSAQEPNIAFPIVDLGGCTDKSECKTYCDDIAHINRCVAFAKTHGLMSEEEAKHAEAFVAVGGSGPSGCTSMDSCEAYCENTAHINECVAFGEKNGLIPAEELAEAKKIAAVLEGGASLPGGCTSKRQCESYCSDSSHMKECLAFAESTGLIPEEELAEAQKVVAFLESGGTMPGGCRGKGECETFCQNEANTEECMNFALKAGFVSEKEAEIIKKTGGKGPGGCRGRACETYCQDPANRQVCTEFAMQYGLMSEEEQQQMREGAEKMKSMLSDAPPEVVECIHKAVGDEVLEKMRAGGSVFGPESGDTIKNCFETYFSKRDAEGGFRGERPEGERSMSPRDIQMPPEIVDCARSIFGSDFLDRLESGSLNHNEFEDRAKACVAQMHPPGSSDSGTPPEGFAPPSEYMPGNFDRRGSYDPNSYLKKEEYQGNEASDDSLIPQEYPTMTLPRQTPQESTQEPTQGSTGEPTQTAAPASAPSSESVPAPTESSAPAESLLGAQVISALKSLLNR